MPSTNWRMKPGSITTRISDLPGLHKDRHGIVHELFMSNYQTLCATMAIDYPITPHTGPISCLLCIDAREKWERALNTPL